MSRTVIAGDLNEAAERELIGCYQRIAELERELDASRALVNQYGAEKGRLAQDRDEWKRIAGERREKLAEARSAAERLMAHLGDPEDWAAPCGCFEDVTGIRAAMEEARAALARAPASEAK